MQALWQVWGVNLKNLYGQTESGVVTAQFDRFRRPGTVGRRLPGNGIALGADDEIICISPGSFSGYWQDEAASADVPARTASAPATSACSTAHGALEDRRSQEGHRHHRGRQECQPEPDRDRAEVEPLYQRGERGRGRAASISRCWSRSTSAPFRNGRAPTASPIRPTSRLRPTPRSTS